MLILMTHDNKTYLQKGMKANQLPKNVQEKEQYSLQEI